MRRNMCERYVKEILEKLEEIEKLHGKLRRLVPRVKVYESEGTKINQFIMEKTNDNARYFLEQNPIDFCQRLEIAREMSKDLTTKVKKLCQPNTKTRKYFRKFKHYSNEKWKSFKDYLSTMNASDIIFGKKKTIIINTFNIKYIKNIIIINCLIFEIDKYTLFGYRYYNF